MEAGFSERVSAASIGLSELFNVLHSTVVSGEVLRGLRRLVDQADLVTTFAAARFHADGSWAEEGRQHVGEWMAAECKVRSTEGRVRVDQRNVLQLLPMFLESLLAGKIGVAHLRVISTAVTPPRQALALRDQVVLLHAAQQLTVHEFDRTVRYWAALCDDELNDPTDVDKKFARRSLRLHQQLDGTWRITGELEEFAGELVNAAIRGALPEQTTDDLRTLDQRRHDALTDIAKESLAHTDRTSVDGHRPHVNVVVEANGDAFVPSRHCLSSFTRDMLMCDCERTVVCAGVNGVPFVVGTPTSDIPLKNRKAILVRDLGCRFPGCGRSARWSEIHHIRYRQHGGTHELENLVMMCSFHHRQIHRLSLILTWIEPNVLHVAFPSGRPSLLGPPPRQHSNKLIPVP